MRITPDGLVIDRADEHTSISDDLLQLIRSGQGIDSVYIESDVITIGAVNRTVAYRMTEHDLERRRWDVELLP
jgi:hypothetical protein